MDFVCQTCHCVLIIQDFWFCLFGFGEDGKSGLGKVLFEKSIKWKLKHPESLSTEERLPDNFSEENL